MNLQRNFHRYHGPIAFFAALALIGAIVLDVRAIRHRHHEAEIAMPSVPLYQPEATR